MSARGGLSTVGFIIVATPIPYREAQERLRELDRRGWDARAVAVIPTPA